MKLIFAGTPEFAVPCLEALIHAGHRVVAVYTQPDRPAGRGRKLQPSPVKVSAEIKGIPVFQPESLESETARLAGLDADAMIVVAYGLILPESVLPIPKFGCINVHASLLPRWRGAAPIQRAIEAGDAETGVTIMQMDAGLDTGDMLLRARTPILPDDTGGSLHDRLAQIGADTLLTALARLESGKLQPEQQNNALACYARKLEKSEGDINWNLSAEALALKVRAFYPWPGMRCSWNGQVLRLCHADAISDHADAAPGTVVSTNKDGIVVAAGEGQLKITMLQPAGGKAQTAGEFLNGHSLQVGDRLN
jgi:methionyl-tRNA formyltransferase